MQRRVVLNTPSPAFMEEPAPRRFSYFNLNMDYTLKAWNSKPSSLWVQTAHAIAAITLVPFLFLASLEGLGKNGLFLISNLAIACVNTAYPLFFSKKWL